MWDYRLAEPVVAASYFVYPGGIPKKPATAYAGCQWFGRLAVPSDGACCRIDASHRLWKQDLKWTSMEVFGWPLVAITDESRLQELVIAPLLRLLASVPSMDQMVQPEEGTIELVRPGNSGEVAGG
jgi:hypothetical protein